MADLDDFFAKKDRKKGSKGAKKFTTTEELAKKLEETHKREKERLKELKTLTSKPVDGDGEHGGERKDEDEWKDFEEEKKDYTNLKIQNLHITEAPSTEDGDGDDGDQMEENEAGEMVPRKKQPSGPWMNVQQQAAPEEPVREPVRPPPEAQPASSIDGGSSGAGSGAGAGGGSGYVPPHLRGGAASSSPSSYPPPSSYPSSGYSSSGYSSSGYSSTSYSSTYHPMSSSRLRNKAAPDITNEAFFPTLSATTSGEPNTAWGRRREEGRGFEEVRNARSGQALYNPRMAASGQGPNLSLGNRWDTLRDQS